MTNILIDNWSNPPNLELVHDLCMLDTETWLRNEGLWDDHLNSLEPDYTIHKLPEYPVNVRAVDGGLYAQNVESPKEKKMLITYSAGMPNAEVVQFDSESNDSTPESTSQGNFLKGIATFTA